MSEEPDDTGTNPGDAMTDIEQALDSTGITGEEPEQADTDGAGDSDGDGDDSRLPGPLSFLEGLEGKDKNLQEYEQTPIAEAIGPDNSKGALHIARGVDGLSPIAAMNPIVDIGIGVVLLQLEKADRDTDSDSDRDDIEQADPSDDPRQTGDLT